LPEDHAAAIDGWVAANRGRILEFASRLVQIPSEVKAPHGYEREAQLFVAETMEALGLEVDVFDPEDVPGLKEHPLYMPIWDEMPRPLKDRPDVVGRLPGKGGGRSILFSSHIDTVAKEPVPWPTADPFSGAIIEGRLYGRGAYDIKSGLAAGLFAVVCAKELGIPLRGDVIVESVVDEEFGGSHGVLAARLRGYEADVAINAEPTGMAVCPIHRAGGEWKITVKGTPGMAFGHEELISPVYKLARLIQAIQAYNEDRNRRAPKPPLFKAEPELPLYITQVGGGGHGYAEQIGIPDSCYLYVWIEEYEDKTREEHDREFIGFVNRYLSQHPDFDGTFPEYRHTVRYMEGSSISSEHPIFGVLKQAYSSAGREYRLSGAPFACDAYVFNHYSKTPALIIGPGGANAHAPDEYVLVEDLLDLVRIYARTIAGWSF